MLNISLTNFAWETVLVMCACPIFIDTWIMFARVFKKVLLLHIGSVNSIRFASVLNSLGGLFHKRLRRIFTLPQQFAGALSIGDRLKGR
ncbi:hypothetical protein UC8_45420 [Roseimaritima ulvae]|uniref:Uncharacterized protein n=1 Tax=Roseimaritima ulvae TaxID=980254 RepID=A0A5B9R7P9_9BACT|nr:hypothetical protein UC8_45420 [Roseimaritima ulvae]